MAYRLELAPVTLRACKCDAYNWRMKNAGKKVAATVGALIGLALCVAWLSWKSDHDAAVSACTQRGVAYFRGIAAFNGNAAKWAQEARERCGRTVGAF